MKSFLCFAALLLSVGLFGCKPKQTTVAGQVFIVTRGADNVKLGAVEILLIDRANVIEFLDRQQSMIDVEIASRELEYISAKAEEESARADYDTIRTNRVDRWGGDGRFTEFLANRLVSTCPDYTTIKPQVETILKKQEVTRRQISQIEGQRTSASYSYYDSFSSAIEKLQNVLSKQETDARSLVMQLDEFLDQKEAERKKKLDAAKSRLSVAWTRTLFPTVEDYLKNLTPIIVQKTLSDADGKFSFTYPRSKHFTIFASAQRSVGSKTENYHWLVNAPTNTETAQVFLSNNNLIFVDPDGYFRTKPKQAR